jgi:hypothetical protein
LLLNLHVVCSLLQFRFRPSHPMKACQIQNCCGVLLMVHSPFVDAFISSLKRVEIYSDFSDGIKVHSPLLSLFSRPSTLPFLDLSGCVFSFFGRRFCRLWLYRVLPLSLFSPPFYYSFLLAHFFFNRSWKFSGMSTSSHESSSRLLLGFCVACAGAAACAASFCCASLSASLSAGISRSSHSSLSGRSAWLAWPGRFVTGSPSVGGSSTSFQSVWEER